MTATVSKDKSKKIALTKGEVILEQAKKRVKEAILNTQKHLF